MKLNRKVLLVPGVLLASSLILAGCSTGADEAVEPLEGKPITSQPTATPEVEESEAPEENTTVVETLEDTEIPVLSEDLVETVDNGDGTTTYVFTGGLSEVELLKPYYEYAGFIWNEPEPGNVLASGPSQVTITVNDGGTYELIVFTE